MEGKAKLTDLSKDGRSEKEGRIKGKKRSKNKQWAIQTVRQTFSNGSPIVHCFVKAKRSNKLKNVTLPPMNKALFAPVFEERPTE